MAALPYRELTACLRNVASGSRYLRAGNTGGLAMNDQPDQLPFKVEQWDDTGTQVTSVLARAGNHAIAQSAFVAATRLYPSHIVTLRRGACVLQIAGDGPSRQLAFKSNSIGSGRNGFTCG
jgi:hypothetical protein